MNSRKFLTAGGDRAALAALSAASNANADQQRLMQLYIHGLVWNRQLPAPMNDWLIRLYAKADVPSGNAAAPAVPGFATLGDDFHDGPGSHVEIREAALKGDQLTIAGIITESKTAALLGQSVRVERKVVGTADRVHRHPHRVTSAPPQTWLTSTEYFGALAISSEFAA